MINYSKYKKSTRDCQGNVISELAERPLTSFPLDNQDDQLTIDLN